MKLKINDNNSIYFPKTLRELKGIKKGSEFELIEENGNIILKLVKVKKK